MNSRFKSYFLSSLLFVGVIFLSCSEDDSISTGDSFFGTYAWVSVENLDCNDEADNGTEEFSCTAQDCTTVEFRSTGVLVITERSPQAPEVVTTGTYTLVGSTITLMIDGDSFPSTLIINGSVLTLENVDEQSGCTEQTTYSRIGN